ncbi:hypothetical protein L6164_005512 [Bauhinia variegata]|nr:hypothetical protein L6164_005512 [Bauhinia variegata]
MSDAAGLSQFLNAVAEISRGANEPSITPVWSRELLSARHPPRITCTHGEYEELPDMERTIISPNDMQERSFFFGATEIATIRRRFIPHNLGPYTTFEIITACLWRCRTIALQMDPNEEVRMMVLVNGRGMFKPPIPVGFYGNAFVYPAAVTTAGKLCGNPLAYALDLVKKTKAEVTRLTCGGFIFALRFNHTMTDGTGLVQFLNAIAEIAQGANEPSIRPVSCRELLSARNPPRITCTHREYEEVPHTKGTIISPNDLQERSFFFGHAEIATIRRRFVPHHLGPHTSFEIIAACLWRCRTIALQMDPNQGVRMMVLVNGRAKFNPPIPNASASYFEKTFTEGLPEKKL